MEQKRGCLGQITPAELQRLGTLLFMSCDMRFQGFWPHKLRNAPLILPFLDLLSSLHPAAFLLFNTNQPLDATHMF